MKYLIENSATYRMSSVAEVEELHAELKKHRYGELKNFSYKTKDVKEKGAVVDTYYVVTAKLVFNDEKDPMNSTLDVYCEQRMENNEDASTDF